MKKQYSDLIKRLKRTGPYQRVGVFCNYTAFDHKTGKYLPELLAPEAETLTLFLPEHGFFVEKQDQEAVPETAYFKAFDNIDYTSLYRKGEKRLGDLVTFLTGIDLLIMDIQDVGVRYYTYLATIGSIFRALNLNKEKPQVWVVDHPNPAGRFVEGTMLPESFGSLIGWPGTPHRYGLTIGEWCQYIHAAEGCGFGLNVLRCLSPIFDTYEVFPNPSPNIPTIGTTRVYTGQCLLEGTNLSEGRGTTRPFEIFGAPFLSQLKSDWVYHWNEKNSEAVLKPIQFMPTFHKYRDLLCHGFILERCTPTYHSLHYTLKMLRSLRRATGVIEFLEGPYEFGSQRPAIELLTGDEVLLDFLHERESEEVVINYLLTKQEEWIRKVQPYLLYPDSLVSSIPRYT